jgi:hypothetical protein
MNPPARVCRLRAAQGAAIALAVSTVLAGGCGHRDRRWVISTTAPAEYPGVLHAPASLGGDFSVRQSLTIRTRRDGEPVEVTLDAVLQKQGDTLLIVGFGPMNARAFTLEQKDDRLEVEQYLGPDLPFSPRNVVLDVHRVYFKRLPPPAEGFTGVTRGELDGEQVEETWVDGELRRRVFTRPGSACEGAVQVELGAGCGPRFCEPVTASLTNEWFGYSVDLVNEDYQRLP